MLVVLTANGAGTLKSRLCKDTDMVLTDGLFLGTYFSTMRTVLAENRKSAQLRT